jgi:hypothetical protein
MFPFVVLLRLFDKGSNMANTIAGLTNGGTNGTLPDSIRRDAVARRRSKPGERSRRCCEADFALMSGWFDDIALTVGIPITVQIAAGPYASAGWGPPITLTPGKSGRSIERVILQHRSSPG